VAAAAQARHVSTNAERHRVAVIRVEVQEPPADGLLIELLEVAHDAGADRLLGSVTSATQLCRVIEDWLMHVSTRPGGYR
jgi:hypothetical protein